MNPSQFRYDINGLRALAVIAVLLFHYQHSWVSGGFTGVDVFFVISGYLMTAIIFKRLQNNNFSLVDFYKARAKRILPALLAITLILLIIGYVLFEPMTYKLIGQHAFTSLLLISNFTYWHESGYFDVNSDYKFLLHTWSLSVEWQFYIFYPIMVLILYRLVKINTIKHIILAAALVSFFGNLYFATYDSVLAFFLLPTRIWELFVGSLAFLYPVSISKNKKLPLEIIGIGLILVSFVTIPSTRPWAGYLTFIPVLGAYICIITNNPKTILSNTLIQKAGLFSYSIYLIHWPILVFFKTLDISLSFWLYSLLTGFFTFCLYQLIEKKRNYQYKTIFLYGITAICAYYVSMDGIGYRVSNPQYKLDASMFHMLYYGGVRVPAQSDISHFNTIGKPSFIITGDSHARQYANYFIDAKINFIGLFTDGCLGFHDFYMTPFDQPHDIELCKIKYKKLENLLNNNPTTDLVYIQRWDLYTDLPLMYYDKKAATIKKSFFDNIRQQITQLIKDGGNQRQYFFVGRTFSTSTSAFQCNARKELFFYKHIYPLQCAKTVQKQDIEVNTRLKNMIATIPNAHFIDPNNGLCNDRACIIVDKNNEPILSNEDHLSLYGAKVVSPYILKKIQEDKKVTH